MRKALPASTQALDCDRCVASAKAQDKTPPRGTVWDSCSICGRRRREVLDAKASGPVMTPAAVEALPWKPVNSSQLDAIAHQGATLYARFPGGAVYRYEDVPGEVPAALMEAEGDRKRSVGREFTELVKRAEFTYARITIRDDAEEGTPNGR
jgi:hypothetical protein